MDHKKALKYYSKGRELGSIDCCYYMGFLYKYGLGVEKDQRKANECWEEAALEGHEESMYALAMNGGLSEDLIKRLNTLYQED